MTFWHFSQQKQLTLTGKISTRKEGGISLVFQKAIITFVVNISILRNGTSLKEKSPEIKNIELFNSEFPNFWVGILGQYYFSAGNFSA